MMNNLMKMFSFTKNEIKIILFIVSVLIAGFSIKYYRQVLSGNSSFPYDYTKSDEEFRDKSQKVYGKLKVNEIDSTGSEEEQLINLFKSSDDSLRQKTNSQGKVEYSGDVLNINTAGKEDLIDLPGIGESTADKIIQYRESKKGFRNIEDLLNVKGIGKKKFEKLRNYIKTE